MKRLALSQQSPHNLRVKGFLMDQAESDDRNIFVACDADAHLLHAVTHFFGQWAG